jgi:hypothetical protein
MAVKLNKRAFEHATNLIGQGTFVFDEKDMWSEHQPSAQDENEYLKKHGFGEYGKWYLKPIRITCYNRRYERTRNQETRTAANAE